MAKLLIPADTSQATLGYLLADGTIVGSTSQAQDFGSNGIKANVIAESTSAAGVTIDSVLLKDQEITLLGDNKKIMFGAGSEANIFYSGSFLVFESDGKGFLIDGGNAQLNLNSLELRLGTQGDIYAANGTKIMTATAGPTPTGAIVHFTGEITLWKDEPAAINYKGGSTEIVFRQSAPHLTLVTAGGQVKVQETAVETYGVVLTGGTQVATLLEVQNANDAASNQVVILQSGNRATPTDDDEGFISFMNNEQGGTDALIEFARQTWKALDVTSTTKDAQFEFAVMKANSLTDCLLLGALTTTLTADNIALVGTTAVTGALTATSYGGITEANLLDKTAAETISGVYTHTDDVIINSGNAAGLAVNTSAVGGFDMVTIHGDSTPASHHIVLNVGGTGFISPDTSGKNIDIVRARLTLRTSKNIAVLTGINFSPLLQNVTSDNATVTTYAPIGATIRMSDTSTGSLTASTLAAILVGTAEKTADCFATNQYGLLIQNQTISNDTTDGATTFYGIKIDEYTELRDNSGAAYGLHVTAPSASGGSIKNYGIVQAGTGDATEVATNYFEAATTIGAAQVPTSGFKLDVQGDAIVDSRDVNRYAYSVG
jgi:hypothetical protein